MSGKLTRICLWNWQNRVSYWVLSLGFCLCNYQIHLRRNFSVLYRLVPTAGWRTALFTHIKVFPVVPNTICYYSNLLNSWVLAYQTIKVFLQDTCCWIKILLSEYLQGTILLDKGAILLFFWMWLFHSQAIVLILLLCSRNLYRTGIIRTLRKVIIRD